MNKASMTEPTANCITGIFSVGILPQANGQYICKLSSDLNNAPRDDIQCYGQTKDHAIAIALEKLAAHYRELVELEQNLAWDAVTRTETGELINKRYHIILHYETIAEDESTFEARHNTIMGNTVVENAMIAIVEIDPDLPVDPIGRSW
jgi:hypothetical protein